MEALYENLLNLQWQHVVMWCIGGLLIYLAVAQKMEPALLLPMGFGRDPGQPAHVRRGDAGL